MKNKLSELEEGFTLTETVIAVFILSLASILLFMGGQKLFVSFNSIMDTNIFLKEAAQADILLKDLCNDIQIPFWEEYPEYVSDSKSIELPYLKGNKDSVIKIAFTAEGLNIKRDDETQLVFQNLKIGYFEPLIVDEITYGIQIILIDSDQKDYRYKLLFGSYSLVYGNTDG